MPVNDGGMGNDAGMCKDEAKEAGKGNPNGDLGELGLFDEILGGGRGISGERTGGSSCKTRPVLSPSEEEQPSPTKRR